jgi:putative tricarboxylic transport membrane protein
MELLDHLGLGFSVALLPQNLLFCLLGTFLGTVIGVLPGIGPLATISMLLPLSFGLPPVTSLIMLSGIYYGAQYGGSTTAILVNLPGEASSTVTMIDGYQMALRGRAGPALAAAGIGSFFAGTVATLLVAVVAAPLMSLALSFGPTEYCALMVIGLVSSIALASGPILKAIGMICAGLLLGLTGTDIYTNQPRFTFGIIDLLDGIDFVAIAVGVFGIGEILRNLEGGKTHRTIAGKVSNLWPGRNDLRRMVGPAIRGTAIGSFLGVLPGGGALLSSFVAYNLEKKISLNRSEFGKGAIEGVTAPESANNAAAQTSYIPMLSLGLPATPVMALMIGALTIQGITPGPNVMVDKPDLFWGLIASMWVGNAMLIVLNLPLIGIWVSLLRVPYDMLFPAIVTFCCIGVYSVSNSSFGVYLILISGLLGYGLAKFDCEWAPFFLGFVLGPLFEHQLRRAMLISGGDPMVFLTRPISAGLLAVAVIVLAVVAMPAIAQTRRTVFVEDEA